MTGKTWLKWDQIRPRQYRQEKNTMKNQTNKPKKNPNQNPTNKQKNLVLWKGAPPLRSLHSWRHVPRGSQFSRVLRGGREADLLTGANLFQHSPHIALPVCLPSRCLASCQQTEIWPPLHIPPLPYSTSVLTGPGCQSWDLPVCLTTAPKIYEDPVRRDCSALPSRCTGEHCTSPLNCSRSGVQLTKCHGGNSHHQSMNCQLKENI